MKHNRTMVALASLALVAILAGCGGSSDPTAPSSSLDTTPPPVPTSLAMSYSAPDGAYELTWAPSPAPDLAGYEVYVYSPDPSRDNAYVLLESTTDALLHVPVPNSQTQSVYRVRATDQSGNHSGYSAPYTAQLNTLGAGDAGEGLKRH